jgi:hypothetical protein
MTGPGLRAPSAALRDAVRARAVPVPPRPEAAAGAEIGALAPGLVAGVVFFGSQRTGAAPDAWSAYDLFAVVDAYRPFYEALRARGRVRRSPALLAVLNRALTPSQISLTLPNGRGGSLRAKCSVISVQDLRRETGPSRADHFAAGRLFQPSEVLFAADGARAEALLDALVQAVVETYAWVRPWLPGTFDAEAYCRTLIHVSMSMEIRPEPTARRAESLLDAQRAEQLPVYRVLLEDLRAAGELAPIGDAGSGGPRYALVRPVRAGERLGRRLYFEVSRARATARWLKYVLTFDDWLDYILRKVHRHTGQDIELTPRERRFPLLFLWPRVLRYLRQKDRLGGGGS